MSLSHFASGILIHMERVFKVLKLLAFMSK